MLCKYVMLCLVIHAKSHAAYTSTFVIEPILLAHAMTPHMTLACAKRGSIFKNMQNIIQNLQDFPQQNKMYCNIFVPEISAQ